MKFAYLIMAHHRFDVLKCLLQDLDDERNDIYLHIDKKTKNICFDELKKSVKKSKLYFIKSQRIYWSDYSQIRCILNLLSESSKKNYDYYHFLVGVEFPLKSQEYIHSFFEKNYGKIFVGFDNSNNYAYRVKYYYFFTKYARFKNKNQRFLYKIGQKLLRLQIKLGINRLKKPDSYYHKGYANWSITDPFVKYILENKRIIHKEYKHTKCADELFIHTLLFHSSFYKEVYDINDEYKSAMRLTTWDDPFNQFHISDLPFLLSSDKLFARKFDDEDALELISNIKLKRLQ